METAKLPLNILQKVERRWSERLAQAASRPAAELKTTLTRDDVHPEDLVPVDEPIEAARNPTH